MRTKVITYKIDPLPAGWNAQQIVGGINHCLDAVSAITPIEWKQVTTEASLRFSFSGKAPDTGDDLPAWVAASSLNGVITYQPKLMFSTVLPTPANTNDFIAVTLHELVHFLAPDPAHSSDPAAAAYPTSPQGKRRFDAADIAAIQSLHGGRVELVPGQYGANTVGLDAAVFDGAAGPNLIIAHVDDPDGANQGWYRVGWGLDTAGRPTAGWSQIVPMGDPIGHSTTGLGIAVGELTGGPGPDLLMAWMDDPNGANQAHYRIGRNLDGSGMNATWPPGPGIAVPGWYGNSTQGFAVALGDIDHDGRPEVVLAWIDDPGGENRIYLRIGRDIDPNGVVATWSDHIPVPGHVGANSAGLGAALTDLRGNGRPDLLLCWVDDRDGENRGFMRIGWDLDETGTPLGGWTVPEYYLPGWWGASTMDAGAAVAGVRGFARPDLIAVNLDDQDDNDQAYYRVLSPPLPAWQVSRPLAPPGSASVPATVAGPGTVDHLAAVAPLPVTSTPAYDLEQRADAIVVGVGTVRPGDGAQDVIGVFWDKTDLNENAGSDIVDLVPKRVPAPLRRPGSPLAIVSRERAYPASVDLFWIDATNRIATSAAGGIGTALTDTVPDWGPVMQLIPGPTARVATAAVPGSPIAAATLHPLHMGVFVIGAAGQLSAAHWSDGTWDGPYDLAGPWPQPVTALAVIDRHGVTMEVYLIDGEGGIWAVTTERIGTWTTPQRIFAPGTARPNSPLSAVTRAADQIDLFWIAPDGSVSTSYFHDMARSNTPDGDGWAKPFPIDGGEPAASGSGLAAVHGGEGHLQVFWEGTHRAEEAVVTTWWGPRPDGAPVSWAPPVLATGPGTLRSGTDIAAAARAPGHVRVFFADRNGNAAQTWWGTAP